MGRKPSRSGHRRTDWRIFRQASSVSFGLMDRINVPCVLRATGAVTGQPMEYRIVGWIYVAGCMWAMHSLDVSSCCGRRWYLTWRVACARALPELHDRGGVDYNLVVSRSNARRYKDQWIYAGHRALIQFLDGLPIVSLFVQPMFFL